MLYKKNIVVYYKRRERIKMTVPCGEYELSYLVLQFSEPLVVMALQQFYLIYLFALGSPMIYQFVIINYW